MRVARSGFLVLCNKANTNGSVLRWSFNDWVEFFGVKGLSCQRLRSTRHSSCEIPRGGRGGGGVNVVASFAVRCAPPWRGGSGTRAYTVVRREHFFALEGGDQTEYAVLFWIMVYVGGKVLD